MSASAGRVRLAIAIIALIVVAGLFALKQAGVDGTLLRILAVAGGLLVTMLFVTYRALLNMAAWARSNPDPPPPDDDEDER